MSHPEVHYKTIMIGAFLFAVVVTGLYFVRKNVDFGHFLKPEIIEPR